jgi:5-methyltetrahydrofolate--homocysteine methyltransferase
LLIIGEKINGTRASVAKAVAARDAEAIRGLAARQFAAGAAYLDVNAGTAPDSEPGDLAWLVERVLEAAPEAVICLDTANPAALAAGLARVKASGAPKVMVNSLSGERKRLDGILPLAAESGAELVVLALDDRGVPGAAAERLAIVRGLVALCRARGLEDSRLFVDPLVMTLSTDAKSALTTLETMRAVKAEFPDVHLTCGHSNVSFGMPLRSVVNQAFMVLTIAAGLDSAITDPENRELKAAFMAAEALLGLDRHCLRFNKAFRSKKIGPPA